MSTEGLDAIRSAIEAELKQRGWSRARLARESGADPNTISDFLNGKREASAVTLGKLEAVLGSISGTPEDAGEDERNMDMEPLVRIMSAAYDLADAAFPAAVEPRMVQLRGRAVDLARLDATLKMQHAIKRAALDWALMQEERISGADTHKQAQPDPDDTPEQIPVSGPDDFELSARTEPRITEAIKRRRAEAAALGEESQDMGGDEPA